MPTREACDDVPDSWSLHPLVIQHVPSDEDKQRCPALVGVEDILYGDGPACVQTTYRTQGNNAVELAKGAKTDEERCEKLDLALRFYDGALDVDLASDLEKCVITQKEADERVATLLANKAEALRLLGRLSEAYEAATLALVRDKECWKAYLRRARICEELDDVARAVDNYKKAYDTSFKPDVLRLLQKARDIYAKKALEYAAIAAFYQQDNAKTTGRVGLVLPFCNLKNTLSDAMVNAKVLHIVYPEFASIERIESFSYSSPLTVYLDILYGTPRGNQEFDTDYKKGNVILLYGIGWSDIIGASGQIKSFSSMSATFVEADPSLTFNQLLDKGCTIPLVPTLFAVSRKIKSAFLKSYPGAQNLVD